MRRWYVKRNASALIACLALGVFSFSGAVVAQPEGEEQPEARPAAPFMDGIAAVVNQDVITLRQLDTETRRVAAQLQQQNIPVPDIETLRRQVLQRMIMLELQRQEAVRLDVVVTDAHVEHAVQTIADRNNLTVEQLRHEIEGQGMTWENYLTDLREEVQLDMLRQRAVDHMITISDAEVDAFLRSEGRRMSLVPSQQAAPQAQPAPQAAAPSVLGLAHILVQVPEGASRAQVDELRRRAEELHARIRAGDDFAGVAASSSDGPNALQGGNMGVRPIEGWPDLFVEATRGLREGEISDIFQSGNGFHILQVVTLGPSSGPATSLPPSAPAMMPEPPAPQGQMLVTQTHARHILIKPSQVLSDEQAQQRLQQVRDRLRHGEDFAELAKSFSEDTSAPLGGDLGWLTPGDTVPAFEQAMNMLAPGEISEPVRSQFGWHLIQVLERRTRDMEDEFKRMRAREILFQRRVEPALEDWLGKLRGEAYIENRLEPSDGGARR